MVFNCKGFFADDDREAEALIAVVRSTSKADRSSETNYPSRIVAQKLFRKGDERRSKWKLVNFFKRKLKQRGHVRTTVLATGNSGKVMEDQQEESAHKKKEQTFPTAKVREDNNLDQSLPVHENMKNSSSLRIKLQCDCCREKIVRFITDLKGVDTVSSDTSKDLITVTGDIDMKKLIPHLQRKYKRRVELVPAMKNLERTTFTITKDYKDISIKDSNRAAVVGGHDAVKTERKPTEATDEVPVNNRANRVRMRPPSLLGDQEHGANNWNSPSPYWQDAIPTREEHRYGVTNPSWGFHRLSHESHITEMFSDENANACAIM